MVLDLNALLTREAPDVGVAFWSEVDPDTVCVCLGRRQECLVLGRVGIEEELVAQEDDL